MSLPLYQLPVVQNWDCHVCGTCCQEYLVTITDEERRRIEAQGWDRDADLGGYEPFRRTGPPWSRRTVLNHRADGSCVFLSDKGRCRIHERFGYETKPLPCRLFPFVLVPAGDRWAVGLRFACPSVAQNKGRPLPEHNDELRQFAVMLAEREGLQKQPDGSLVSPPFIQGAQRLAWPDVHRLVDGLLDLLRDQREPMERRLRKCVAVASEMRGAKLENVQGARLSDLFSLVRSAVEASMPDNLMKVSPPGWIGRVLFRQAAALYTRKDHGPNRGMAGQGRVALLFAAMRFARGSGSVPRMHKWLPETTFAEIEKPRGPIPMEVEDLLERYYTFKVGALQFCGAASFGLPFWEGFEALALTFPVLHWVARAFGDVPREEAFVKALSIVDDHFGFNKVLATARQRVSFRILAWTGELSKLIAWYSR
jgi:lysine-N-methylase